MQSRGSLMVEHRLIERMVALIEGALGRIESEGTVDPDFIGTAIDFIRTYADRTHHGKEEDILFRDLATKDLSADDRRVMEGLIEDHKLTRTTTTALAEAAARHRDGDCSALADISAGLRTLVDVYPRHIEMEDKVFFPAARTYVTEEEDRAVLAEFWEFDRRMIHEKYTAVVEALGG